VRIKVPNTRVVDLSHWNTIPKDLKAARKAGVWGVIHKATESSNYVDPKLDARCHLARDAGLLFGVYHFLRPGSMADQANWFLKKITPYLDDKLLIAADYEDAGVSLAQLDDWMHRVSVDTGRDCVLYSGHVLKDAISGGQDAEPLRNRRLWLAQYAKTPVLPVGWSDYWIWQWTDKGTVAGIDPPVDCNQFNGTIDELEQSWSGAERGPAPEPAPTRPTVTITTTGDVEVIVNGVILIL
jgi:lysozyme